MTQRFEPSNKSKQLPYGRPPPPTPKNPYAQVDWIFSKRIKRISNYDTQSNYQNALSFYKRYLSVTKPAVPIYLSEELDEFVLMRVRSYLDKNNIRGKEGYLTSHTVVTTFSALRSVIQEAALHGYAGTRAILNVALPQAVPETDAHKAYTDLELEAITQAVAIECQFARSAMSGYKPVEDGNGRDPRKSPTKGAANGYGWGCEPNIRWYFENVLAGMPITYPEGKRHHRSFLAAATNLHGGLHNLYRHWGVTAYVDEWLVCPLLVKLLGLTGINPASALELDIDCYGEVHPLTGAPYLVLNKPRSGGELSIHLPLLDGVEAIPLKSKQAYLVKRTIDEIKAVTAPLRTADNIPADLRGKLFIYQSNASKTCAVIRELTSKTTSRWCRAFVEKHSLKNSDGGALRLNLVRYRPTLLTQMALKGHDLFEIQQVARHKNIRQTIAYIDRNKLDAHAHRLIASALTTIHENRKKHDSLEQVSVAPRVFKGLLADCLNVFDPPERIKNMVEYVPGQPCVKHNMCLFCRNVIIFREHLPTLAAYRNQLLVAFSGDLRETPYFRHYENTLAVLNELLDPETSEFSTEDIAWAQEQALTLDVLLDTAVYRASKQ